MSSLVRRVFEREIGVRRRVGKLSWIPFAVIHDYVDHPLIFTYMLTRLQYLGFQRGTVVRKGIFTWIGYRIDDPNLRVKFKYRHCVTTYRIEYKEQFAGKIKLAPLRPFKPIKVTLPPLYFFC